MNTRRAILKLIGATPAAASGAKAQIAAMLESPAVLAAGAALRGPSAGIPDMIAAAPPRLPSLLHDQLQSLRQNAENERGARHLIRRGLFDPDIAALKSVSHAYKARLQYEREMEDVDMFAKVNKMLWG